MALNSKITDWKDKRVWIVGASTGIGAALASQLNALKAKVAVSARSADKLNELVDRLGAARAMALPLDITKVETIKSAEAELVAAWGGYDLVVFMAGDYTAMRAWELDLKVAKQMVSINWEGFLNGLDRDPAIRCRQSRRHRAGLERSRLSWPAEESRLRTDQSRAHQLAEVLYLDLKDKGLDIYVICPGFVKTPMTDKNDFEMPSLITPEEAAAEIIKGLEKGEFEIHFPKGFTRMLKLLRHLPYSLYFPAIKRSTKL